MILQRRNCIFLLVLLSTLNFAYSRHFRTVPSEKYSQLQGLDLVLNCVTENRVVTCLWLKNGNAISPSSKYNYSSSTTTGDCSLKIRDLQYPKDNQRWECQVPSLFENDYNIKWPKTQVVVLVKPYPPVLDISDLKVFSADFTTSVMCRSKGGNPMPRLEWHLNDMNITRNSTSRIEGNDVYSNLTYLFQKIDVNASLRCVSVHPIESQQVSRTLDIQYKPHVSVSKKMYTVSDGHDLEVECEVDANPPTKALWKPTESSVDSSKYRLFGNKLIFSKIDYKMDGKVFQCSANNQLGNAEPVSAKLDVLYKPKLLSSSPSTQRVKVNQEVRLTCEFVGNPKPRIVWNYIDSTSKEHSHPIPSSNPAHLVLTNLTYLHEGDYYCDASNRNSLLNSENVEQSTKMSLDVYGPPLFMKDKVTINGYIGLSTKVELSFCSDPLPTEVYWLFGSQRIVVKNDSQVNSHSESSNISRPDIEASKLITNDYNPYCFRASLIITNTDYSDARDYTMVVKNSLGITNGLVVLKVNTQLSLALLISISLIVFILVFIITVIVILFRRRSSKPDPETDNTEVPFQDSKPKSGSPFK